MIKMYIKKSKKAFSLVEVMLLFVITSLIMAAALPFITRASRPIPKKMAHGMYRCYATENDFIEEYYNSYARISSKQVAACKFEVPKNATLFKIDLIGAGAGGNNYMRVSDESENVYATYNMDTGLSGSVYVAPSETMLKRMFGGLKVKLCHKVAAADSGGNIKYTSFKPENFNCTDLVNQKALWTERANIATTPAEKDAAKKALNNIDVEMKKLHDWAKQFAGQAQSQALNDKLVWYCKEAGYNPTITIQGQKVTVRGGQGGDGGYISYEYTINGYSPSKYLSYTDYLKNLKIYNEKGYCESTECRTFRNYSSFENKKTADKDLSNSLESKNVADDGASVGEFSAIKKHNGTQFLGYITNSNFAKGGKGAAVDLTSDGKIQEKPGDKGDNAKGCEPSCSSYEPYIYITTNFNRKVHELGNPGGSGDYKTIVSSNLSDFCTFKIHNGGPIYEGGNANTPTPDDLATTITCGDFSDSVKGGEYNYSTWKETYSIASEWDGNPNQKIDSFVTNPKTTEPKYKSNYFWLSYNLGQNNFGKGGDGAGVTDKCTEPKGDYKYTVKDKNNYFTYNRSEYIQNFTRRCNNDGDWIEKRDATQGTGGAVIIVW